MGVLDEMDLDNIPEEQPAEAGEHEVRIISAELYTGKESGKTSIRLMLSVQDAPDSPPVFDYWAIPTEADDTATSNRKRRRIRDGLQAFGLTKDAPFDDWVGCTTWALLAIEQDNRGEPRNVVKRYIGGGQKAEKTNSYIPF